MSGEDKNMKLVGVTQPESAMTPIPPEPNILAQCRDGFYENRQIKRLQRSYDT
jgi:hypothetical protein